MSIEAPERSMTDLRIPSLNGPATELGNHRLKVDLINTFGKDGRGRRKLEKGEKLFRKGDDASHIFVVISGRLRVDTIANDGERTHITEVPRAGEAFGLEALSEEPYSTEAEALVDSEVLSISVERIRDLIRQHPATGLYFLHLIAEAEMRANKHLEILRAAAFARKKSAADKGSLADALLDLVEDDNTVIAIQETVGVRAGKSRRAVNRALKTLAERKIVELELHRKVDDPYAITILDRARLQSLADGTLTPQTYAIFSHKAPIEWEIFDPDTFIENLTEE